MTTALTVLVVEDYAPNGALSRAAVEDEGCEVTLVDDGAAAIAAFERCHPRCILLDVQMAGLDGIATCERIRRLPGGASVAIVFVTAQHDVETFDRAVAAGGDDFVTKPYRPRARGSSRRGRSARDNSAPVARRGARRALRAANWRPRTPVGYRCARSGLLDRTP